MNFVVIFYKHFPFFPLEKPYYNNVNLVNALICIQTQQEFVARFICVLTYK